MAKEDFRRLPLTRTHSALFVFRVGVLLFFAWGRSGSWWPGLKPYTLPGLPPVALGFFGP